MSDQRLDETYWAKRYQEERTGWDIGHANWGLLKALQRLAKKEDRIIIPGAGRAYEAVALWRSGYLNTYVIDLVKEAFNDLRNDEDLKLLFKTPADFHSRLIVGDFFEHTNRYDFFLEQTFFCALDPSRREAYVKHASSLLKPHGKWVGVLFNRTFPFTGPPFGGAQAEYEALFQPYFDIKELGPFSDSIKPRAGSEVLGIMTAKSD